MRIKIDNKKRRFDPDKCGWKHQSLPTTQFAIVKIGWKQFFVKRQPTLCTGWFLLLAAFQNGNGLISNTPRVVGFAKDIHNYYFFTEYLNGDILENQTAGANPQEVVPAIFDAVYSVNKCGYWYSDLCKKNIFRSPKGYYLIDVDSSFPCSDKYTNGLNVAYDYSALIVRYANENSLTNFNLARGHSGECVNQSQLVALAVDAKHSFALPAQKRDIVTHNFLERKHNQLYSILFRKLVNGMPDWVSTKQLLSQIIQ